MNIALHINQLSSNNIGLLDSKSNIVMDGGKFTKINFIDSYFTMNGIFIVFPINHFVIETQNNKKNMKFQWYSTQNQDAAKELMLLENRLLDFYISNKQKDFKKKLLLKQQIETGYMKIYKENHTRYNTASIYVLKISGIWENRDEIGITYKLFETSSLFS